MNARGCGLPAMLGALQFAGAERDPIRERTMPALAATRATATAMIRVNALKEDLASALATTVRPLAGTDHSLRRHIAEAARSIFEWDQWLCILTQLTDQTRFASAQTWRLP